MSSSQLCPLKSYFCHSAQDPSEKTSFGEPLLTLTLGMSSPSFSFSRCVWVSFVSEHRSYPIWKTVATLPHSASGTIRDAQHLLTEINKHFREKVNIHSVTQQRVPGITFCLVVFSSSTSFPQPFASFFVIYVFILGGDHRKLYA